jgi:hypothetical protein
MATIHLTESRTSLDSDIGEFNRIHLDANLRDKILSQLDDSSESLPLPSDNATQDSLASSTTSAKASKPQLTEMLAPPQNEGPGPSRLSQVVQSSDIPTPAATEPPDPLAQQGALRQDNLTPMPRSATPTGSSAGLTPTTSEGDTSMSKEETAGDGEEKKKRPGAMRRITTRIKSTISSKG